MTTQGREANLSGSFASGVIESAFRERGIPIRSWSEVGDNGDMFMNRFVLRNAPFRTLFDQHSDDPNATSRGGYLYRRFGKDSDVRIVPRWQEEPGSADEKLVSLFYNAKEAMPEREIILFVGGGGAREEAIAWLSDACSRVTEKSVLVVSDIAELRKAIKEITGRFRDAA